MANPGFSNSPAFTQGPKAGKYAEGTASAQPVTAEELSAMYGRPAAGAVETERMSYEDTFVKIFIAFAVLLVGAAIGWFIPVLAIPAAIAAFVLALVNIFRKKKPSRGLVLAYAALEGVFVGGISYFYSQAWDGIVPQAVFGTLGVVAVTLLLFLSGKVRSSPKMTRFFLVAMVGYAAFSLVNFGLMIFGVTDSMFGLRDQTILGIPLGLILGVFVVLLAAYSLILDFEAIKTGVERGAPRVYAWQAAFGIMLTVVWLYLEILRMLAISRN